MGILILRLEGMDQHKFDYHAGHGTGNAIC